jgi:hypothetical protein
MREYLTGRCYDFALALAEKVPEPVFVAIGNPRYPDHVGLRIGDRYADVRGLLSEGDFVAHHTGPVTVVGREDVALHCGLGGFKPPYRGNKDIAWARVAVKRAFPHGIETPLESAAPPAATR